MHIFAVPNNAEIAQLVEHNLAKVGVAGPSPVFRSNRQTSLKHYFREVLLFSVATSYWLKNEYFGE